LCIIASKNLAGLARPQKRGKGELNGKQSQKGEKNAKKDGGYDKVFMRGYGAAGKQRASGRADGASGRHGRAG